MTITYPPGYISVAAAAERMFCDPWTVRSWLRRDPTWGGAIQVGVTARALPDRASYPPPPPRRRKHPPKQKQKQKRSGPPTNPFSLRSIAKAIGYSHTTVKVLQQRNRLGFANGRWIVLPKERA